jgi:hypothetical protein
VSGLMKKNVESSFEQEGCGFKGTGGLAFSLEKMMISARMNRLFCKIATILAKPTAVSSSTRRRFKLKRGHGVMMMQQCSCRSKVHFVRYDTPSSP